MPTHTNGPTLRRTLTTIGLSLSHISSSPRRPVTAKFLDTFKEFPPRQRAASFSIDQAVDAMKKGLGSTN
jgi:hypothetical protein